MPAQLIDGKAIAAQIRKDIAREAAALKRERGVVPGLAVVLVGENPASQVYVRNKGKASEEVGFHAEQHTLPAATTEAELLALLARLNADPKIHGILVQLPLPPQLDAPRVVAAIAPAKDVDGFHPTNLGLLLAGMPRFVPCTPLGIMKLLEAAGLDCAGKNAVVIGRSNIVGKPVALLLMQQNATVTIAHSKTRDLPAVVRAADIVVAAIGKARFVAGDWLKPGAAVIDVGINRGADGKLCGDVDFEAARRQAGWLTPVPGGVGPMTIAMLLANTLQAAKAHP